MNSRKRNKWRAWRGVVATAAALLFTSACEKDGDSSDPNPPTPPAATTSSTNAVDASANSHFPDGLHPDSAGNAIIAGEYNAHIGATPSGSGTNDANTVVCLGDSITAGGYPGPLAALSGKDVIDEGKPGEESAAGAARVAGVLDRYQPAYLCILYGANDVISHVPAERVVANLQSIIVAARARHAIPIVGTLTPMSGTYAKYAADAQDVSAHIRAMAAATSTALADLESAF